MHWLKENWRILFGYTLLSIIILCICTCMIISIFYSEEYWDEVILGIVMIVSVICCYKLITYSISRNRNNLKEK